MRTGERDGECDFARVRLGVAGAARVRLPLALPLPRARDDGVERFGVAAAAAADGVIASADSTSPSQSLWLSSAVVRAREIVAAARTGSERVGGCGATEALRFRLPTTSS